MGKIFVPDDYSTLLDIRETEVAIKKVKDYFERNLARRLNLTRVSAPLFVETNSGMNDTLNGVERPVSFDIKDGGAEAEIVHSLAKWKRFALKRYGFSHGEGLYTDMNAVRRDEVPGIHTVTYDSPADTITITHDAHNRSGFALGAVLAAEYVKDHSGMLGMGNLFDF